MKTRPVNKTTLNLEELTKVLELHNAAKDLVQSMQEGFTCTMEQAGRLQTAFIRVDCAFDFAPPTCTVDPDEPSLWSDYVLPENDAAFFSDYLKSQWEPEEAAE
jgi:hypothetical protein